MTWAQTPIGSRRIIEVCPAMYSPADSPLSMRAAPAKKRIWSIAGGTSSSRVSWNGLPVFSLSSRTSSSARSSMASAILFRARLRSEGVASRHCSKPRSAACMAASTSAGPDTGASAKPSPVEGLMRVEVLPSTASRYSPPMKFCSLRSAIACSLLVPDGHARWRRARMALPTAMATPPRKISVPITFTWGGTPTRVAPYTQRGKVSTWPLTKLVTT